MKLEIELDLNKIDYDAINKQIQDKIADLNIQETYDIKSKVDNKIEELIDRDVIGTNGYIERNYWTSDSLTEKSANFVRISSSSFFFSSRRFFCINTLNAMFTLLLTSSTSWTSMLRAYVP